MCVCVCVCLLIDTQTVIHIYIYIYIYIFNVECYNIKHNIRSDQTTFCRSPLALPHLTTLQQPSVCQGSDSIR